MICPKCGFDQTEAHECIRCGVVIAKYMSVLKRKEEGESKFSPVPAPTLEYPSLDTIPIDLSGLNEEIKRLSAELHAAKSNGYRLREELGQLQKQTDALTQTASERVPQIQELRAHLSHVVEQFDALKAGQVELAKSLETTKRLASEYVKTVPESMERMKGDLAKALNKLVDVDEVKRGLSLIAKEIEHMKKDRKKEMSDNAEWRNDVDKLRAEVVSLRSELKNALETKTVDNSEPVAAKFLSQLSDLRSEVDLLKSEIKKLLAEKDKKERKVDSMSIQTDLSTMKQELSVLSESTKRTKHVGSEIERLKQDVTRALGIEDQLNELKSRVNGLSTDKQPPTDSEAFADIKELKADIKSVKILLMDFLKKS